MHAVARGLFGGILLVCALSACWTLGSFSPWLSATGKEYRHMHLNSTPAGFGVNSTGTLLNKLHSTLPALPILGVNASAPRHQAQHVQLSPRLETLSGAEVVWQAPSGKVRAVLFVAHGCSHAATDWWPAATGCSPCIGLPEEVNITRHALQRQYAVVAISSADRQGRKCWSASSPIMGSGNSKDTQQVVAVLTTLIARQSWNGLPIYALGASSGGAFVAVLAMGNFGPKLQLAGVCSQIMGVPNQLLQKYLASTKPQAATKTGAVVRTDAQLPLYPPIIFVHMPRDESTAARVAANMLTLTQAGVAVKEIRVGPRHLTPGLLHEAVGAEISHNQSTAIWAAFRAGGLIDEQGQLIQDPRGADWKSMIVTAKVPGVGQMRLTPDESPVSEVLNVLWAGHELVSQTTTETLDFWEQEAGKLLKRHSSRA